MIFHQLLACVVLFFDLKNESVHGKNKPAHARKWKKWIQLNNCITHRCTLWDNLAENGNDTTSITFRIRMQFNTISKQPKNFSTAALQWCQNIQIPNLLELGKLIQKNIWVLVWELKECTCSLHYIIYFSILEHFIPFCINILSKMIGNFKILANALLIVPPGLLQAMQIMVPKCVHDWCPHEK